MKRKLRKQYKYLVFYTYEGGQGVSEFFSNRKVRFGNLQYKKIQAKISEEFRECFISNFKTKGVENAR